MLLDYMGLPKFVVVADWARELALSLSFIMLVKGLVIVIFVNLDLWYASTCLLGILLISKALTGHAPVLRLRGWIVLFDLSDIRLPKR